MPAQLPVSGRWNSLCLSFAFLCLQSFYNPLNWPDLESRFSIGASLFCPPLSLSQEQLVAHLYYHRWEEKDRSLERDPGSQPTVAWDSAHTVHDSCYSCNTLFSPPAESCTQQPAQSGSASMFADPSESELFPIWHTSHLQWDVTSKKKSLPRVSPEWTHRGKRCPRIQFIWFPSAPSKCFYIPGWAWTFFFI